MNRTSSYLIHNHPVLIKRKWLDQSVKISLTSQLGRELLLIHSPSVKNMGWLQDWLDILQTRTVNVITFMLNGEPHWHDLVECRAKLGSKTRIWGIGGGSVMDLAKLVSAEVSECDHKMQFIHPKKLIQKQKVWLFPTHYSSSAYISSSATLIRHQRKISGLGLRSEKVFIDPNVLKSIPIEAWLYGSIDTISHFVEILCSTKPSNSLRIMALHGWWRDYLSALDNNDYEGLFYLAAFLYSGLFELHAITWPIHHLAHELGPKLELGHGTTLALLLPLFLKSRIQNPSYKSVNELLKSVNNWIKLQPIPSLNEEQLIIFNNLNLWGQQNWFDLNESADGYELKRSLMSQIKLD